MVYQNLEGGFWSIITDENEKLKPISVPVQLQENNKRVECVINAAIEEFSINMWGKSINIYTFVTG